MLFARTAGSGPPVILLHAFPLSSGMWEAEIQAISHAARVIAPDLPGFGKSARQTAPSIPEMAHAVAQLLDYLNVKEPAFVGGLSMGGYVAFEFLRNFPSRVRALGLFSTRAAPDTPEGRENRLKTAEKIRAEGLDPFPKAILPKLVGKTTMQSRAAVVDRVTQLILANEPEGVADALLAMAGRRDSADLLPGLSCPALVVAGEEDAFIPISEAEALVRSIPGARLEKIPGAGHLVNLEQPEAFQQVLVNFLGGRVFR